MLSAQMPQSITHKSISKSYHSEYQTGGFLLLFFPFLTFAPRLLDHMSSAEAKPLATLKITSISY